MKELSRKNKKRDKKSPSPQNVQALKEAIEKAKANTNIKMDANDIDKKESKSKKEVPEETLRKILQGE